MIVVDTNVLTYLATGLTAYDAEFVVAARRSGLKLLTNDHAVLRACPDVAVPLEPSPQPASP